MRGLAEEKRCLRIRDRRLLRAPAQAQVDRSVDVERGERRLVGFIDVGGNDHVHVRKTAHDRQVLQRMMGSAGDAKRNATCRRADDDTLVGIGDIIAYLLHAARADERRVGADVGAHAGCRQTRRHADRILFGDAKFDEAVAMALDVRPDAQQILGIGRYDDGTRFAHGEFQQSLAVCEARLVCGFHPPLGLDCIGCVHFSSSSASALARISSLTELLCQT